MTRSRPRIESAGPNFVIDARRLISENRRDPGIEIFATVDDATRIPS